MYWQTAFYANAPVIYTSYLADDAKRILRNIRTVFAPSLPDWMKRRLPEITNDAVQEIMFSNGSYIELRASGGGDPGRGTPARLIIADEFPAMLKPSDVIASAAPAVEDGGKLILGGTMTLPEGTFFKELWENTNRPENVNASSGDDGCSITSLCRSRIFDAVASYHSWSRDFTACHP